VSNKKNQLPNILAIAITTAALTQSIPVQSQSRELEEIVVTAQRREQTLTEVPISLEAFNGVELTAQGFRTMEDISNYSPSVEIDIRVQDQDVSIRGMGTTGNNLSLEQAAPTFSDGVHMGRTSMIMGAFLDLDRIEILRGPQPVAFGQNATAGAFSLVSRKPGDEWQGNVSSELGNFGRTSVEGGIGGPVSDTFRIRVAGKFDRMTGYIRDIISRSMFPDQENKAGRLTLAWNPTENIETEYKIEYARTLTDGDAHAICRTDGLPTRTDGLLSVDRRLAFIPGQTALDDAITLLPMPDNCDEKGFQRIGYRQGSVQLKPPLGITYLSDARSGILDVADVTNDVLGSNISSTDNISYIHRLGLAYNFENGGYVESTTAYVDYKRISMDNDSSAPVQGHFLRRGEVFDMWSQDLRYISDRGGMLEWEAGVYYQLENLGLGNRGDEKYATINLYPTIRRPVREYSNWQDSEWYSAFGSLTFNFLDDKASIDLGGRYSKIVKDSEAQTWGATWIMNINPDPDNDGNVPSTELYNNNGVPTTFTVRNVANRMINCATRHIQCGSYGAGFWTHQWNSQDIPDIWNTASPVGIGPFFGSDLMPLYTNTGPFLREYRDNHFDPQVVLRYRPTDDHSLYGKWATAFKGGGADLNTGTIRATHIAPEYAETFEVGAKGTLMDRTVGYDIALFETTIDDLQMAASFPSQLAAGTSFSTNAGKQRTRGLEFGTNWVATDRLTLGLSGALMDGVMVNFAGAGCNDAEFAVADTGPCITLAESLALVNNNSLEGRIDRSGSKAPRTPDWKFVLDLDYEHPVLDTYKVSFNSKTTFSDGYVFQIEDFDESVAYPKRVIANLNLGFGNLDDVWSLTLWVRNLFDDGIVYNPEFDVFPEGIRISDVPLRNFRSYGIQYQYNYN